MKRPLVLPTHAPLPGVSLTCSPSLYPSMLRPSAQSQGRGQSGVRLPSHRRPVSGMDPPSTVCCGLPEWGVLNALNATAPDERASRSSDPTVGTTWHGYSQRSLAVLGRLLDAQPRLSRISADSVVSVPALVRSHVSALLLSLMLSDQVRMGRADSLADEVLPGLAVVLVVKKLVGR